MGATSRTEYHFPISSWNNRREKTSVMLAQTRVKKSATSNQKPNSITPSTYHMRLIFSTNKQLLIAVESWLMQFELCLFVFFLIGFSVLLVEVFIFELFKNCSRRPSPGWFWSRLLLGKGKEKIRVVLYGPFWNRCALLLIYPFILPLMRT